jgi:hypothetical protein
MLLVDTELRTSSIHGLGAFLLEPVREGQLIWRFDRRFDQIIDNLEVQLMPETVAPVCGDLFDLSCGPKFMGVVRR